MSAPGGSALGGCLLQGEVSAQGVCLLLGGCVCSGRGLLPGGVSAPRGCLLLGGVSQHALRQTPSSPVDRILDTHL